MRDGGACEARVLRMRYAGHRLVRMPAGSCMLPAPRMHACKVHETRLCQVVGLLSIISSSRGNSCCCK